ncbi:MAG: hypothetical protein AAFQ80_03715 [Cyanobacteria bacterium J06621_8]
MQSKQKITLYIPPELHRKLKIKAAVDAESMSALVQKALSFYMRFPDEVAEIESSVQGRTHQVHVCPECEQPLVMRGGEMTSLISENAVIDEEMSLGISGKVEERPKSSGEELVSCL